MELLNLCAAFYSRFSYWRPPARPAQHTTPLPKPSVPEGNLTNEQFVEDVYYPAVVLLFSQDDAGDMHMRCTATAVEKDGDVYSFVTASHCASTDDSFSHKAIADNTAFYISPDESHQKDFIRAQVEACGSQSRGDDFCLLKVRTDHIFPIVSLGRDSTAIGGEEVVNIASPMGLGKQVFYGRVTSPRLDRPVVVEDSDINWTNTMLLELPGTNGGSSGSAVVCLEQRAICGFLVGTIAKTTEVAMPVSRFEKFETEEKTHKYKYFDPDPEDFMPSLSGISIGGDGGGN